MPVDRVFSGGPMLAKPSVTCVAVAGTAGVAVEVIENVWVGHQTLSPREHQTVGHRSARHLLLRCLSRSSVSVHCLLAGLWAAAFTVRGLVQVPQ